MNARLGRLVAAAVLAAATGLAVVAMGAAPAEAAVCADAGGVSVVVDFRELGGGVSTSCDADGGGKSAATLFLDAGFALTYVQRQPGFVCRIDGIPTSDPCVATPPASAYWGLYWSNGTSGSWSYSSLGVGSLTVPAGGSVAFAWQGQSQGPPGVSAPSHGGSPTPSPSPSASPSPTGTGGPTSTPSSSASPTKSPTKPPTKSPTKPPATSATASPTPGGTGGSRGPSATPTTPGASPTADGSGSAEPSATDSTTGDPSAATSSADASDSASALESASTETAEDDASSTSPDAEPSAASPTAEPPDQDGGSVPLPVVLVVMGLLGAAVAGVAILRNRRT